MGIIYKLKPEIKNWILEKKRTMPNISCRQLVALVESEFKIKASKSSINTMFKAAGLSMPVGRRQKKRRPKIEATLIPPQLALKIEETVKLIAAPVGKPTETPKEPPEEIPAKISVEAAVETPQPGSILLRAADYIIGGSYYISEMMKSRLNLQDKDLLAKVENLIYAPKTGLKELQGVSTLAQDIARTLSVILQEAHCIEVRLTDGDTFYLDGQLHTLWSTPHIPYDFANTIHNIKNYINKYFSCDKPFILFMAPGYDTPTKELFNFILSLKSAGKKIVSLTLFGNKLERLETIPLDQDRRYSFILGLWPWQFVGYRKVKKIGEFKPFYFEAQSKNFYVAEIEIELAGPLVNRPIVLTGCALKTSLAEKIRLLIMGNIPSYKPEDVATLYLNHWPNLEGAFQDFSRKVELFTYTANSQRFFPVESLKLEQTTSATDIKEVFNQYFKSLDLYVRWRFMPSGYEDQEFTLLKEQFYDLKTVLKKQKDCTLVTFQLPQGFSSQKALEYLCRRLNEREITLSDSGRLWFLF